ncbi:MAG: DUF6089 family protein [Bacteroidia bacterium]|nr:DUF6089 family protein [Bacteroidia bacterium]
MNQSTPLRNNLIVLGFLCFAIFFGNSLFAQRSAKISLGSGTTYYNGDLTDGFLNNLYRPTISVGLSYYVNPWVSIRGEVNQAWIGAADSLVTDPIRSQRNLHFRSAVTDFSVQLVIELLEDRSIGKAFGKSVHFTPYVFGGIGGFAFRPMGLFQGEYYDLQSLGTEGQFLIGSTTSPYSRFQLNIPFGGGIEYRFGKNWGMQIEASYRYLFTDYLDDISTVFPDQEAMRNANPVAAYFANPSGNFDLFTDGSPRGNPRLVDSYIFVSVKAVYFFEKVSRFSRCYNR